MSESDRAPESTTEDVVMLLEPEESADGQMPELVDLVLEAQQAREDAARVEQAARDAARIDGVVIGRIVGLSERGPIVRYAACPSPSGTVARSATAVTAEHVGQRAALMFEGGDASLPMLMGLLVDDEPDAPHPAIAGLSVEEQDRQIKIKCDKAIALTCGKAHILVTPSGKIVLRGKYLLTRSSGINRIQGGSVRIN